MSPVPSVCLYVSQNALPPLEDDQRVDAQAIAAIERITRGNFRLLERLFPQIGRVLKVNQLEPSPTMSSKQPPASSSSEPRAAIERPQSAAT